MVYTITDIVKFEKQLLSFEIKEQRPVRLGKQQLVDIMCEQQDLQGVQQVALPIVLAACRIKRSDAGTEGPLQKTHITCPTQMNPVLHFISLLLMASAEKVGLSEYDPGLSIMEKSS